MQMLPCYARLDLSKFGLIIPYGTHSIFKKQKMLCSICKQQSHAWLNAAKISPSVSLNSTGIKVQNVNAILCCKCQFSVLTMNFFHACVFSWFNVPLQSTKACINMRAYVYCCNDYDLCKIQVMQELSEQNDWISQGASVMKILIS
jgi:hypothetical protein